MTSLLVTSTDPEHSDQNKKTPFTYKSSWSNSGVSATI